MSTRGLNRDPTRTPLRCAVYARVSSDRQDVENSLDRQLAACREWARRNGAVILEDLVHVDEERSGASMLARPAFQRLLELLRGRDAPPFDAVLVDDDSRLDRGGRLAEIASMFRARNVRLVPVDSGRDLTDEDERLLVHLKSGMNEHSLLELARRTRDGLKAKVRRGFHAGGRTYGYRLVREWPPELPPEKRDRKNRIGTRIEIDEGQARTVRRIFELYLSDVGFREIAHRLNADGVLSSRGRAAWDPSGVRGVLTNPRYIGDWSWNRRRWQKVPEALLSEAERDRAKITGRHPRRPTLRPAEDLVEHLEERLRIIDAETWAAVQARFRGRARTTKGGKSYNRTRHPIAGLMRCECGGAITVARATRRGHAYVRLGCAWHRDRGPDVCGNGTWLRLEAVADPLLHHVRGSLLAPERVARAVALVNRKIDELAGGEVRTAAAAALEGEIRRLEGEVGRLVDALAKGTAYAAIGQALAEKDRRLGAARVELAAIASPATSAPPRHVDAGEVRARLEELREDLEQLEGDRADRARMALQRIFSEVVVHPLGGRWEAGWRLEMRERPWEVLVPRGVPNVVQVLSCGGPLGSSLAFLDVRKIDAYARGPRRRTA